MSSNYERRTGFIKWIAKAALYLGAGTLALYVFLLWKHEYLAIGGEFSLTTAKDMGPFFSAIGIFFTLGSTLLVLANLREQERKNDRDHEQARKSRFEKMFFDVLTMHDRNARAIEATVEELPNPLIEDGAATRPASAIFKGKNFFEALAEKIAHEYLYAPPKGKIALMGIYTRYFQVHNGDLGHYYRSLYHLINFLEKDDYLISIEKATGDVMKREHYFKILRAQLTNAELTCLAYNGMTQIGSAFKALIEKHKLLKNLNFEMSLPYDYEPRVPDPGLFAEEYPHLQRVKTDQKKLANCWMQVPDVAVAQPFHMGMTLTLREIDQMADRTVEVVDISNDGDRLWIRLKYQNAARQDRKYWVQPEKVMTANDGEQWKA